MVAAGAICSAKGGGRGKMIWRGRWCDIVRDEIGAEGLECGGVDFPGRADIGG